MNAQQRRALILSRLPLIDSGGPVWLSLPPEAQKRTKSATKAKRLRGRYSYRDGYIDVRADVLHMLKLGLVKRERSGMSSARRTHFVPTKPSENPKPEPAELAREIEMREQRMDEKLNEMKSRIETVCAAVDKRLGDGWTEKPENRALYSAVVFARSEARH
jgi:hypothetical protein